MEAASLYLDDFSSSIESPCSNNDNQDSNISTSCDQSTAAKTPSSKGSSSGSTTSRRKFTEEEDKLLSKLVSEMGPRKWDQIAKNMPNNRTARQCRDRYSNYLIPGFFNGEWSKEEDELLYRKYQEYGPKWAVIKEYFTNRSPNAIKNRWNYFVSRSASIASSVNAEKQNCEKESRAQNYMMAHKNDNVYFNEAVQGIYSPPSVIKPNASAPMFPIWAGQNYISHPQQLSPIQPEIFSNGYSAMYNGVNCGYYSPNQTHSIQLNVQQNVHMPYQIPNNFAMCQNNFNNYSRCGYNYNNTINVKPNVVPRTESIGFGQSSSSSPSSPSSSPSPAPSESEDENVSLDLNDDQIDNLFDDIDSSSISNDDELKLCNLCYLDTNESDIFNFY